MSHPKNNVIDIHRKNKGKFSARTPMASVIQLSELRQPKNIYPAFLKAKKPYLRPMSIE